MDEKADAPVAGWYTDESGKKRWWDGEAWGPYAPSSADTGTRSMTRETPEKPTPLMNPYTLTGLGVMLLGLIAAIIGASIENDDTGLAPLGWFMLIAGFFVTGGGVWRSMGNKSD